MKNKKPTPKKIIITERYFLSPSSAMDNTNLVDKFIEEKEVDEKFRLKELLRMGRILSKTVETKEELEEKTDEDIDFEKRVSYELVSGSARFSVEVLY